jgi:hypothetical protein
MTHCSVALQQSCMHALCGLLLLVLTALFIRDRRRVTDTPTAPQLSVQLSTVTVACIEVAVGLAVLTVTRSWQCPLSVCTLLLLTGRTHCDAVCVH